MKNFTNTEKMNGEMIARGLSGKAWEVYEGTDPLDIYATSRNEEEAVCYVRSALGDADDLSFYDLQEWLEDSWTDPEAIELADEINGSDEWNPDDCRRLCELAGMEAEWDAADGEIFEAVVERAAEKLGVEIYA